MTYILAVWTFVAGAGQIPSWQKDWRPIGEFKNQTACVHAAKILQIKPGDYVCLPTDTLPPAHK